MAGFVVLVESVGQERVSKVDGGCEQRQADELGFGQMKGTLLGIDRTLRFKSALILHSFFPCRPPVSLFIFFHGTPCPHRMYSCGIERKYPGVENSGGNP